MISVRLEAILELGRVHASESCGELMIGNSHEKDLNSLLETLKDTTEAQCENINDFLIHCVLI